MDKWIGLLLITICMALVAIGSLVTYQMFNVAPQGKDTFGNTFNNQTNSTKTVESAIAPVSISVEGYLVLISVVFVIVGAGVAVARVVMGGNNSHGMR